MNCTVILPFMPEVKCPPNSKQKKLLTSLESTKHYITHYSNLKQALKKWINFKESPYSFDV